MGVIARWNIFVKECRQMNMMKKIKAQYKETILVNVVILSMWVELVSFTKMDMVSALPGYIATACK